MPIKAISVKDVSILKHRVQEVFYNLGNPLGAPLQHLLQTNIYHIRKYPLKSRAANILHLQQFTRDFSSFDKLLLHLVIKISFNIVQ